MSDLLSAIRRSDIPALKDHLKVVSVLSHDDLCFAACHASPEALELCLPYTNPTQNQSEALVWGLKNTANPTRSYDIFCVLRKHCDVQESIGMLEGGWGDELFELYEENEELLQKAKNTLIQWEAKAQKSALVKTVGDVGKDTSRRKM